MDNLWIWLVVEPPLLTNMKVNWDDDSQFKTYGKIKNLPNHPPGLDHETYKYDDLNMRHGDFNVKHAVDLTTKHLQLTIKRMTYESSKHI